MSYSYMKAKTILNTENSLSKTISISLSLIVC